MLVTVILLEFLCHAVIKLYMFDLLSCQQLTSQLLERGRNESCVKWTKPEVQSFPVPIFFPIFYPSHFRADLQKNEIVNLELEIIPH